MSDEKKEKELTLDDLKKELEECQKQRDEYLAGWQRSRADFLNYKKEEIERLGEILKYAGEEMILKLLPILDNFEMAEKEIRSMKTSMSSVESYEEAKIEELIGGFVQIKNQLRDFLKNQGVEEIKTVGEKFDPNFMEAIEMVEREGESGTVLEEIQKGYTIHGRLLRPAKVRVTK